MSRLPKRKPGRRKSRPGRGALWIIAALFVLSGGLQLAQFGAWAREATGPAHETGAAKSEDDCIDDAGFMAMLADLKVREAKLVEQEGLLSDRRNALALAETRLEARLNDLVAAEEALSKTVAVADGAAEKDVGKLVALYENMKPKQAAPLFAEMDPNFAAGFLARMRPAAAAAVMESLEPKTAYAISVLMAGRNAGAPRD
ncbi:MgtE-like protein [Thioclava sp. ES.031]|uniref:MotE family protein n=1 Tax=Thioclava sp. ES.031 TaxID=1798203 RepID=UPI000BF6B7DC|nr:hypothetical protein [Thioclava sp. ES.031]PFG61615.1 MgtE-like protein [Thioclava sp. ES.031]